MAGITAAIGTIVTTGIAAITGTDLRLGPKAFCKGVFTKNR